MTDFRVIFKNIDDAALINMEEYGQLLGLTLGAIQQKRHHGELAEPAIQGGKVLRWRAGDVRAWLLNLCKDTRRPDGAEKKRLGRPRRTETVGA